MHAGDLVSNIYTNELHSDIITLSHQIGREGFEELTIDIAELTTDEAPNEEQIIESISEIVYGSTPYPNLSKRNSSMICENLGQITPTIGECDKLISLIHLMTFKPRRFTVIPDQTDFSFRLQIERMPFVNGIHNIRT
ncbi:Hypothetical predicted protein [Octopus vulgaris]|uniref:Uncharacterized protein n=1 Tax=Octopus vulgaris TaxID=6645 RepID=A0AA36AT48_OCTVU|nr:Hypothetical predicted protein [Octopus vulgaris]